MKKFVTGQKLKGLSRVRAGKMRQLLLWDSLIFELQTNANETYYYGDYFLQRQKMNLF